MPHRRAIDRERPREEETGEAPAPSPPALGILDLQRTAGNAAVSRLIAARQPAPAATQTPEERLERAFFDDDWDRIVALTATRSSPSAVKRIAGLSADELRYLDDAVRRADQEGSWLAKVVKSEFGAKKVPEKQQAPGAGYGKVEFKNTLIEDGDPHSHPRKSARYRFEIKFMPNYLTIGSADEIGFIQVVRVVDLDDDTINRAANGRHRLASDLWHVDRIEGRDQGWFDLSDRGMDTRTMRMWRKSDWDEPAWMRDTPSRTRGNISFRAETAIVCRRGFHAGKVYATVHWGFEIDKDLVVTPYETDVFNKESETFRSAVAAWNAQASGPETNRSSDNQQPLPTIFR